MTHTASAGGAAKLLTISGSTDATHVAWSLASNYLGAARLDAGDYTGADNNLSYAEHATIGIRASSGSGAADRVLISGHSTGEIQRRLGEFEIPALVGGTTLSSLNIGANSQNFINAIDSAPTNDGEWAQGQRISGIYVDNGRVIVNVYGFYDDLELVTQTTTVLNSASAISTTSQRGFYKHPDVAHLAGWISPIPSAYQAADKLNGNVIFGMSSGNLRSRNNRFSNGPSAYVYDTTAANSITGSSPISGGANMTMAKCLDYPLANAMTPEANFSDAGYNWTHLSEAYYGFIVPGTKTYMVIGFSGGHVGGISYGVPPYDGSAGSGFYPIDPDDLYNYYWLFDVDDLIDVKNGVIANAYTPQPYEHGQFPVEFGSSGWTNHKRISGAAFDPANGRLYISLYRGDNSQGAETAVPLLLAYDMSPLNV